MTPDFYSWNPGFRHRKRDRVSLLDTNPTGLVMGPLTSYTTPTKSQSFRLTAKGNRNVLEPLASGVPVTLRMKLPRPRVAKKTVTDEPTLVVIVPGRLIGADRDVFMVSVIGKGAALVAPIRSMGVASLVMAGIPARLASSLLRELRLLLWSDPCRP